MSKQYQGQPAEGYKPLREWGQMETLSNEELEAWKRSPVARLESRVIATISDLERQLAKAQGKLKRVRAVYIRHKNCSVGCTWRKDLDRILSKEGNNAG